MQEHRHAVLAVLLALQGALILAGGIVAWLSASAIFPLDQLFGTDASIAAIVLGAAFVMAFRTVNRTWVNLALMYEGLTVIGGLWKYYSGYGTRLSLTAIVISAIFAVLLAVFYPRGELTHGTTSAPA